MLRRPILLACALGLAAPCASAAVRPGPDLLYAKPAVAPQLTNAGPWKARPILISGQVAYRRGEFVYQDYLYDDHGAKIATDPRDPRKVAQALLRTLGDTFSKPNGTYTYPYDDRYANNAADLVEFRVRRLRRATAFRTTLNTLKDPSLIGFTIAIARPKSAARPLPFGANVSAPADVVVTVHPDKDGKLVGEVTEGASGRDVGRARVRVDAERRQVDVRLPHRVYDPRKRRLRVAMGVGLWDSASGRYLLPQAAADEDQPGGGGTGGDPAAFFNVAFRTHEDVPSPTEGEAAVTDAAWWRDRRQGELLAKGDISRFSIDVDFRRLARRVTDNSRIPRTGPMDRILASRFELDQGVDFEVSCFPGNTAQCPGQYQGRLQPYAIYVPKKKRAQDGYGLTLLLHSLSANYNQYLGSRHMSQFGERGNGYIVITPEARGPEGFYENYAAADVFEVWADVRRRYKLDRSRVAITGYSMGGIGSFKLGSQFPDLFARAQPTVGFAQDVGLLPSLRHVPVLMWNNRGDELVNDFEFQETARALDQLGYRYELDAFQPCMHQKCSPLFPNHLQLAVNDQYAPAAAFLDDAAVVRNPHHVTYVVPTALDRPELQLVGDGAYWVSGLTVREGAGTGRIDAISHATGQRPPESTPMPPGVGTMRDGHLGNLTYDRTGRTWSKASAGEPEDRLEIRATNIATATIDVRRARLTCGAKVDITSDGPISVTLAGCDRTVTGG